MFSKSGLFKCLKVTLTQLIKSNVEEDIQYTFKIIEIIAAYADGDKAVKTCLNDRELLSTILSLLNYNPQTKNNELIEMIHKIHVYYKIF